MKLRDLFRIEHPDIAWHIVSIMLHVFGGCALAGYLVTLHWWLIPMVVALGITFYSGYHFELGFRSRRFSEMRYR